MKLGIYKLSWVGLVQRITTAVEAKPRVPFIDLDLPWFIAPAVQPGDVQILFLS